MTKKRSNDWLSSFLGQSFQLAAQAASFLLLARHLGIRGYALWVGLAALSGLTVHVAGLGFGNLLVRNTARDRSAFAVSWGNALLVTLLSGSVLMVPAIFAAGLALPSTLPTLAVAAVFASELVFFRLVTMVSMACQGLGRIRVMAYIGVVSQAARLAGVAAWILLAPTHSFVSWTLANGLASFVASALVLGWAFSAFDRPAISLARIGREWRDGIYFVLSPYTQLLNNDADKLILGRLSTLDALGAYGAAYRVLAGAWVPVQSLLAVTYPAFFQRGRTGIRSSMQFARLIAPQVLGTSALVAIAIAFGAPAVGLLLGSGYEATADVLRWLCILPVLKAVQFLFADGLTGAGFQRLRTTIQAGAAALNIVLNLLLDSTWGWRGAAFAALVSDGLLAVGLGLGAVALAARDLTRRA